MEGKEDEIRKLQMQNEHLLRLRDDYESRIQVVIFCFYMCRFANGFICVVA